MEARHLRVILDDDIVDDTKDPQLELELLEEGQGLLDGQPVSYVLFRSAQQLEDGLPRDLVLVLALTRKGLLVEVVERAQSALAFSAL